MIVVFGGAMLVGFAIMVLGSRAAVGSATALAAGSKVPPFFIGITLLAIGTDLPEIANSIAASLSDHGDINVGDSVGSAATQATLVLGLLPMVAGRNIDVPEWGVFRTGASTVVALVIGAVVLADGTLGRLDGILLVSTWVVASRIVYSGRAPHHQLEIPETRAGGRLALIGRTMLAFGAVGGAAMISLWGIIGVAEELGAPEFLVSFFLASVGTSLPELVFDVTAIRRGATVMAIGNIMGSSLADSTLSVGIGPIVAPTEITADLAVRGAIVAAVALVIVTALMSRIRVHDWRTGTMLLGVYSAFFLVMLY